MSDQLNEKSDFDNPYHLGYLFHYPQFDQHEPFRLDISIASVPTNQHYDPEKVEITVLERDNENLARLVVEHPWKSGENYRVCAGVIRMIDRKGKVEEAFTFGGNLSIALESTATSLVITSPAPIYKITNTSRVFELLRDEYEIMLAERRAHWIDSPGEFERKLMEVEPMVLYQSMLRSLIHKLENMHNKGLVAEDALHYLHSQVHRLEKAGAIAKKHALFSDKAILGFLPKVEDIL